MPFEYDIFISYGHLDDEDPAGEEKGWVDLLVERLPRVIAGYLGDKPKIWRDEHSLHGNDMLQGAISAGIAKSLVLVPIVSPRYVRSDWCRIELETFCHAALPPGADPQSFSTRIFKVIKSPLRYPHLIKKEPELLRDMKAYPFFEMDEDSPDEFSPDVKPGKDQRYWTMLRRLAQDISDKLVLLKQETELSPPAAATKVNGSADALTVSEPSVLAYGTVTPPVVASNGEETAKLIYLAETTSDLTKERELVRDELRQRGHTVLPEQKLPIEELKQTEAAVRADLARCALSVHLVGTRYGSTPEDDARSTVRIQEQLAAEYGAANPAFLRLLWMPPGLTAGEISDERQKNFVAELQNRITAGAELLQTSVEDLKTRIVEKLNPPAKAIARGGQQRLKLKQVYLICESTDRSFVKPIKDYLFKQNLEVITWAEGTGTETRMDYHRRNLRECDAALVYFGSGDEPWVRKNLEDLVDKAFGYGRADEWTASGVYVGAPLSEQKEDFDTHMVPYVIRNFNSFDPNDLREFVSAVQTAEGGH
ncbi:MAG TPA: TIR domain-containing protein [Pyrinomonadaceae bacterium]|nr:TIR domain-containing protein [Pyrinomonadaceae bacterium]